MSTDREQTIDVAKGIAIIAIVLGHVLRGLDAAGIISEPDIVDRMLYMFHLSVFAFLSALFVRGSATRAGYGSYVRVRTATFLYLYVVWMLLQGSVKLITASLVNTPSSLADVLSIWIPDGQLWFLPWIALMTVVVVLIRPWERGTRMWCGLGAAAVVSLVAWGLNGDVAFTQGLGLTAFYFLGAAVGAPRVLRLFRSAGVAVSLAIAVAASGLMVVLVLFTTATPPTSDGDGRTVVTVVLGVVASTAGLLAVLAWARVVSGAATGWLAFLGKRSLEIFLAHIIAAAGTRIGLTLIGVDNPSAQILVGLVAGVGLPLVMWAVLRRLRFPWLFSAPSFLTRTGRESIGAQRRLPDRPDR